MISEIINELSDKKVPLSEPLLRLKIVAKRIKSDELFRIVSKEIEGYDGNDDLPEYRMVPASSFASIQDGWNVHYNQPMPFTVFNDKLRIMFTKFPVIQGIEFLEDIANSNNDTLAKVFGADFSALVTSEVRKIGWTVSFGDIRVTTHKSEIIGVLGKIRSKFLDLVLELESNFPEIDNQIMKPLENENEIKNKTTQFMAQINITNSGDGNVINTGSGNEMNISLNINKNDIESLKNSLRKIEVNEEDISEISEIIQQEEYNKEYNKFGTKVQGWMQKMLGKALDGSWKIGIGAAGGLLAKIISSYYGIG